MKNILKLSVVALSLSFPIAALAATSLQGSATLVTSPITVRGDLTVETGSGLVGKSFMLDGSKSYDDGVVRSFEWRQIEGPFKVVLSSASSIKPTFTPTVPGTYVFELVATDSTGLSSVVQKREYIVQHNETDLRFVKPNGETSIGDPDFDIKTAPSTGAIGDVDRDGAVDVVVGTVSNEGRDRASFTIPSSDGSSKEARVIGDPDFDLLNIDFGGDDLEKFRAEVSTAGVVKKVIVRGWDPQKKEEIVGSAKKVKTAADLKIYVEAIALSDVALKGIKIKENVIEVESREQGQLFWLIPIEMSSSVEVMFNPKEYTVDRVKVQFPWWHIFVKKSYSPETLQAELAGGLDVGEAETMRRLSLQAKMSHIALTLQIVSNIMKTKHDTAKNSISNIR